MARLQLLLVLGGVVFSCAANGQAKGGEGRTAVTLKHMGTLGERRFWHGSSISGVAIGPDDAWLVSAGDDGRLVLWDAVSGELIRSIETDDGPLYCVDVSPDGFTIVSGGAWGALCAWNTKTGKEMWHVGGVAEDERMVMGGTWAPRGDKTSVNCVAIDPSGTRVALGRGNGAVELRAVATGQLLHAYTGHPGDLALVDAVAWHPTGKWFISGGPDEYLRIWDPETGQAVRALKGPAQSPPGADAVDRCCAVQVSADGKFILSAGDAAAVQLWDAESGRLVRNFPKHNWKILAATFGPSGEWIASGGWWDRLRWWDTTTGEELNATWRTLWTISGEYEALTLSPDGTWCVTGDKEGNVRTWTMADGRERFRIEAHSGEVAAVATNGTLIASGGEDGLCVWNAADGTLLQRIQRGEEIAAVAISPDGQELAFVGGRIGIVDTRTWKIVRWLTGHEYWVSDVEYSPDGTKLLTASSDDTVKIWDRSSGELLRTYSGHESMVTDASWGPDGRWIASVDAAGTLLVWDSRTGETRHSLDKEYRWLLSVAFSVDGGKIAAGDELGYVKVWDLETGSLQCDYYEGARVQSVRFGPDSKWVVSAGTDYSPSVWDPITAQRIQPAPGQSQGHRGIITSMAASRSGTWLATASSDGCIKLWDVRQGTELHEPTGHADAVTCLVSDPKGRWVASGSADTTIRLWDTTTRGPLRTLSHHEQEITALVVTPDGERLISGSSDRRITVWNAGRGEVERTWQAHSNAPCSLVACPDGVHVISGGSDGTFAGESTVKVWDVRTGEIVRTIDDFNGAVSNVLLDPTGRYLVTRSPVIEYEFHMRWEDRFGGREHWPSRIDVWDIGTGAKVRTITESTYEVYALALSADGKTLASGSKNKTITLWDIASGKPIKRLMDAEGAITALAFADDGRWLIGSSTDHCTRIWCARSGQLLGRQTTTAIVTRIVDRGHELWFGMSDGTIGVYRVASG